MTIDLAALFQRVLDIMTVPARTWRVIAREPDRGRRLLTGYVMLLAGIPTVCGLLGNALFGYGFWFSLIAAVLRFGVFVGSVYLLGMLVNALGPSFGTVRNENAAYKLVAYASTPVWIAGFFTLVPQLSLLAALAGFGYSAYLFHLGCQALMETPAEKSWGFSLAAIGVWFAMVLITVLLISQVAALIFAPAYVLSQLPATPPPPVAPPPVTPPPVVPTL